RRARRPSPQPAPARRRARHTPSQGALHESTPSSDLRRAQGVKRRRDGTAKAGPGQGGATFPLTPRHPLATVTAYSGRQGGRSCLESFGNLQWCCLALEVTCSALARGKVQSTTRCQNAEASPNIPSITKRPRVRPSLLGPAEGVGFGRIPRKNGVEGKRHQHAIEGR